MMVMIRDWTLFEDLLSRWSVSSDSISIQKDEMAFQDRDRFSVKYLCRILHVWEEI